MGKSQETLSGGSGFVKNFVEKRALVFQQLVSAVSLGTVCKICSSGAEN